MQDVKGVSAHLSNQACKGKQKRGNMALSKTLVARILSALILAPAFLWIILKGGSLFVILLFVAFAISMSEWFALAKKTQHFAPILTLGILYMALSYSSFFTIRDGYSAGVVVIFIVMIWCSDIGAYFTGKILGGPKLIQQISPNKTWSGFWGALFFPALFGAIWITMFGLHSEFTDHGYFLRPMTGIIFGVIIGATGQAGDLLISYVKRLAKVKDSGHLIPGHGGLLDRIDSMLLGSPIFLVLITMLEHGF
ncbi:MAG: phosphatidate cytidylyltransferase [Alphaproteobacteria bacterium]|nr:phosphatidate cytidylyltransferase [Alphaproteobacteria bacterium]